MPNEMLPMSTWTPKDGQTYEIVDAEARERITELEEHGGGGGGSGTVKSVNSIEPDSNGNVSLSANDVGAGTYSKPSGGIPASDLAAGVIPSVPQMATQANMSDWTSGKTVDAATLKTNFTGAMTLLSEKASQTQVAVLASVLDDVQTAVSGKANISDIPTAVSDLTNDSGYQTAAQVQTAIEETVMVVHLTPTSTDLSGVMDKTGSEILTAYSAGKRIVAEVDGLNGSFEWNQTSNGSMVTQFLYNSGSNRELIQVVASGSSTAYYAYHIAQLPAVTASDNGKFLRVVSGAWAVQALTDVSEVGA